MSYLCTMIFRPLAKFLFFLALIGLTACSEYNKVVKSNDMDYKLEKALEYYDEGDYFKALPLLEELLAMTRGSDKAENIYYHYAMGHYEMEDYYLAAYYLKEFSKTYPGSQYAEDCGFLSAMCHYYNSPDHTLDQSDTKDAINAFQLFLNRYPATHLADSCNKMIDELSKKLEVKAFENAKQYYHTMYFKSAEVALRNVLTDFPGTEYEEEIYLLILKSNYELAKRSVENKKKARLEKAVKSYHFFIDKYMGSKNIKEAENIYDQLQQELQQYQTTG